MCKDCGCEEGLKHHHHRHDFGRKIVLEKSVLAKNDEIAHHNRHWFEDHHMHVVNLISSPGSGKTLLLEKTLPLLKDKKVSVLVGDQETDHDAQRLLDCGGSVKQINTFTSCHLDAQMISKELGGFVTGEENLLIIENIGNLVCPAAFDLGENHKVAILSTTEGEDKPVKYPVLFNQASVVVITKMDLAPHLDWSLEKTKTYIRQINPKAKILELSAKTGAGMKEWIDWLSQTR